ncbi:NAD(P)H-dependent flavin oxidoreductase YrpB, nitropropane dioxygenase family [Thermomonospora echinospora]|uniref:NAD(P)H-dependent flavin oxidoreductase YrpB, nitropropane dioxygenase family n=1 Tax=Thermomonospora echinospora TaxID=1992 RepID=A0A1H5SV04_9ACTN|nr:nitronate monooxygenase family protein [Thermomonospora echinospora]SEF54365.1 NAD(P)H-dependent flavin oxidoreductase YrpB, nitropropane dioxygenase family [Thermomonospora echinospora]
MRTEICEMFGIEFPLLAFSHCRDVVAAVTNAGGMGVLGAVAYTPDRLEEELSWIDRQVGGRPYGVDVLVPAKLDLKGTDEAGGGLGAMLAAVPQEHWGFLRDLFERHGVPLPDFEAARRSTARGVGSQVTEQGATDLIDVSLAHPIRLIASALGTPPPRMVEAAKSAGVPVAALVGTAEHARRQVAAGVDLIVAQGGEAGGHTGEISTMVLVPEVVDTVAPIPVLAAGGIATGRQMAAAMALGACGVWCGSVWLTTEEAETPPHVKAKMLAATSRDTVRSRSRTGKPARQLRSAWTDAWEGPDSPGSLGMPLQMVVAEGAMRQIDRVAASGNEGARELANYFVGQCVGLMNTVRPARQVVYDMVQEFTDALDRLNALSGTGSGDGPAPS